MFKKQGQCILELGKIVQFIYLYYSKEEKQHLINYFNVEKEFQPLFNLIKSTQNNNQPYSSNSLNSSSMFVNNPRLPKK